MMTQREMLNLQENINGVFKTHWDRIDKLEVQVARLQEELAALKKKPAAKKTAKEAPKAATEKAA